MAELTRWIVAGVEPSPLTLTALLNQTVSPVGMRVALKFAWMALKPDGRARSSRASRVGRAGREVFRLDGRRPMRRESRDISAPLAKLDNTARSARGEQEGVWHSSIRR